MGTYVLRPNIPKALHRNNSKYLGRTILIGSSNTVDSLAARWGPFSLSPSPPNPLMIANGISMALVGTLRFVLYPNASMVPRFQRFHRSIGISPVHNRVKVCIYSALTEEDK